MMRIMQNQIAFMEYLKMMVHLNLNLENLYTNVLKSMKILFVQVKLKLLNLKKLGEFNNELSLESIRYGNEFRIKT